MGVWVSADARGVDNARVSRRESTLIERSYGVERWLGRLLEFNF
jgi:hypothetical protein